MSAILLDTNACIRFLAGDERVLAELGRADAVHLSVFVLGELSAGFAGGGRGRGNRDRPDAFLAKPGVRILETTRETAELHGVLHDTLKRAGTPIALNDVWIAAHTFEASSVLLTFDAQFESIPNLRLLRLEAAPRGASGSPPLPAPPAPLDAGRRRLLCRVRPFNGRR